MRRRTGPTMWEVAEKAGVSQATVSLVVNDVDGGRVNEATRERVLAAVAELGYRTNAFAKSLRSGESGFIGFISDEVASAPFAGALLKGAQLRGWDTENVILSVDTYGDAGLEAAAIDMMLSYRVKGVVYASMYHRSVSVPAALRGLPVVVVNAQDRDRTVPSVFPDEEGGGHRAAQRLLDAGHTRIGMINIQPADSDLPAGIGRLAGFRRALREAGVDERPEWMRDGTGIVEDGYAQTLSLMAESERPTALFCANDRTAWGAYRALDSLGMSVPDDCAIIGFDNHEMLAPFLDPGLTTLALPYEQMARTAVDLLVAGSAADPVSLPIECSLIERGSVTEAKVLS